MYKKDVPLEAGASIVTILLPVVAVPSTLTCPLKVDVPETVRSWQVSVPVKVAASVGAAPMLSGVARGRTIGCTPFGGREVPWYVPE
jgi:hypothetical protein